MIIFSKLKSNIIQNKEEDDINQRIVKDVMNKKIKSNSISPLKNKRKSIISNNNDTSNIDIQFKHHYKRIKEKEILFNNQTEKLNKSNLNINFNLSNDLNKKTNFLFPIKNQFSIDKDNSSVANNRTSFIITPLPINPIKNKTLKSSLKDKEKEEGRKNVVFNDSKFQKISNIIQENNNNYDELKKFDFFKQSNISDITNNLKENENENKNNIVKENDNNQFSLKSDNSNPNNSFIDNEVHNNKSFFIFSQNSYIRQKLIKLLDMKVFWIIMMIFIVLDSFIVIGILNFKDDIKFKLGKYKSFLSALILSENIILVIYFIEILFKCIAYGVIIPKNSFCKSFTNIFDLVVLITSVLSYIFPSLFYMKTLRYLKLLKLVNLIEKLNNLFVMLLYSLKEIKGIIYLIIFYLIIFSFVGMIIFEDKQFFKCMRTAYPVNGELKDYSILNIEQKLTSIYRNNEFDDSRFTRRYFANNLCGNRQCPDGSFCVNIDMQINSGYYFIKPDIFSKSEYYSFKNINNAMFSLFLSMTSNQIIEIMDGYYNSYNFYLTMIFFYFIIVVLFNYFILKVIIGIMINSCRINYKLSDNYIKRKSELENMLFIVSNVENNPNFNVLEYYQIKELFDNNGFNSNDNNDDSEYDGNNMNKSSFLNITNSNIPSSFHSFNKRFEIIIDTKLIISRTKEIFINLTLFKEIEPFYPFHQKWNSRFIAYYISQQPITKHIIKILSLINIIMLCFQYNFLDNIIFLSFNFCLVLLIILITILTAYGKGIRHFLSSSSGKFETVILVITLIEFIIFKTVTFFCIYFLKIVSSLFYFKSLVIVYKCMLNTIKEMINFLFLVGIFVYFFVITGQNIYLNKLRYKNTVHDKYDVDFRKIYDLNSKFDYYIEYENVRQFDFKGNTPSLNFDSLYSSFFSVLSILIGHDWNGLFIDCYFAYEIPIWITYFYFIMANLFLTILLKNLIIAFLVFHFEKTRKNIIFENTLLKYNQILKENKIKRTYSIGYKININIRNVLDELIEDEEDILSDINNINKAINYIDEYNQYSQKQTEKLKRRGTKMANSNKVLQKINLNKISNGKTEIDNRTIKENQSLEDYSNSNSHTHSNSNSHSHSHDNNKNNVGILNNEQKDYIKRVNRIKNMFMTDTYLKIYIEEQNNNGIVNINLINKLNNLLNANKQQYIINNTNTFNNLSQSTSFQYLSRRASIKENTHFYLSKSNLTKNENNEIINDAETELKVFTIKSKKSKKIINQMNTITESENDSFNIQKNKVITKISKKISKHSKEKNNQSSYGNNKNQEDKYFHDINNDSSISNNDFKVKNLIKEINYEDNNLYDKNNNINKPQPNNSIDEKHDSSKSKIISSNQEKDYISKINNINNINNNNDLNNHNVSYQTIVNSKNKTNSNHKESNKVIETSKNDTIDDFRNRFMLQKNKNIKTSDYNSISNSNNHKKITATLKYSNTNTNSNRNSTINIHSPNSIKKVSYKSNYWKDWPNGFSLFLISPHLLLRKKLFLLLEKHIFHYISFLFLIASIIVMSLEYPSLDPKSKTIKILHGLDYFFSVFFFIEMILRIFVQGMFFDCKNTIQSMFCSKENNNKKSFYQKAFSLTQAMKIGKGYRRSSNITNIKYENSNKNFFSNVPAYFRNIFNIIDGIITIYAFIQFILLTSKTDSDVFLSFYSFKSFSAIKPISMINKFGSLKRVVSTILQSIKMIISLIILIIIICFTFGIMLNNLIGYSLGICSNIAYNAYSSCTKNGYVWHELTYSYQSISTATLILIEIGSGENWFKIMYSSLINIHQGDLSWVNLRYFFFSLLFLCITIITSLFLLNLIYAVIVDSYSSSKEDQMREMNVLSDDQKDYYNILEKLLQIKPNPVIDINKKMGYIQKRCIYIVNSNFYKILIYLMNLIFILSLVITRQNQSVMISNFQFYIFLVYIIFSNISEIIKIKSLHKKYFKFFTFYYELIELMILNIIFIIEVIFNTKDLSNIGFYTKSINNSEFSFLPLLICLKIIRIRKITYLIKGLNEYNQILYSLIPNILNITYLIILFFVIYANVGVSYFAKLRYGKFINKNNNFETFENVIYVLIKCLIGSNWNSLMQEAGTLSAGCSSNRQSYLDLVDYGPNECGSFVSYIYFMSFYILFYILIMHLFIAIIVDSFITNSRAYKYITNCQIQAFYSIWSKYDPNRKLRINPEDLILMMIELEPPFGFSEKDYKQLLKRNYFKGKLLISPDNQILIDRVNLIKLSKSIKMKIFDKDIHLFDVMKMIIERILNKKNSSRTDSLINRKFQVTIEKMLINFDNNYLSSFFIQKKINKIINKKNKKIQFEGMTISEIIAEKTIRENMKRILKKKITKNV